MNREMRMSKPEGNSGTAAPYLSGVGRAWLSQPAALDAGGIKMRCAKPSHLDFGVLSDFVIRHSDFLL